MRTKELDFRKYATPYCKVITLDTRWSYLTITSSDTTDGDGGGIEGPGGFDFGDE